MKRCSGKGLEWWLGVALALLSLHHSAADAEGEFSYSSDEVENNLVILNCESGGTEYSGCGFIALMNGNPYLLTSQHIILGADSIKFASPTGRTIRPRSIELSESRDIARMALPEGDAFALSRSPSMDAPVGVFGSTPEQLQVSFFGSITGVGAEIVEVSADFTEKHSGSPILSPAKEVVGMASHVRASSKHAMKKGTKFENKSRRFCYRLDGVKWKAVNWKRFNKDYGTPYREGNIFIDGLIEILNSWADEPFDPIHLEEETERTLVDWASTHNKVVGNGIRNDTFQRKQYAEYSESTRQLADACRSRARKTRMLAQQRGLTEFLCKEYDMQAGTLEYFAKTVDYYTTTTDY